MAETKAPRELTWREKADQGLPLNEYDRIKRDAEILTLRRIRDNQEDAKLKAERSSIDSVKFDEVKVAEVSEDLSVKTDTPENSEKGN